jgi:D-ribose pyranose/furanose isomerase RbsD
VAKFQPGQTVKTTEAVVTVDAGLPVGTHRFQLQVVTDTGQRSVADVVQVSVVRTLVREPLRPIEPVRTGVPIFRRQP